MRKAKLQCDARTLAGVHHLKVEIKGQGRYWVYSAIVHSVFMLILRMYFGM